jgi:CHAT domain-containing protein
MRSLSGLALLLASLALPWAAFPGPARVDEADSDDVEEAAPAPKRERVALPPPAAADDLVLPVAQQRRLLAIDLLDAEANQHRQAGRLAEAITVWQRKLALEREAHATSPQHSAQTLQALWQTCFDAERYAEAARWYRLRLDEGERAGTIWPNALRTERQMLLTIERLARLGPAPRRRAQDAITRMIREVPALREPGSDHVLRAVEAARRDLVSALGTEEDALVATLDAAIGVSVQQGAAWARSLAYLRRAEQVFAHLQVDATHVHQQLELATWLEQALAGLAADTASRGRWAEAFRLADEALARRTRRLGPAHHDTVTARIDRLWCLEMARRSAADRARFAASQAWLRQAEQYEKQGDRGNAHGLRVRAAHLREAMLGASHLRTVECLAPLARAHRKAHQWQAAAALLVRIFLARMQQAGEQHPSVDAARNDAVAVLREVVGERLERGDLTAGPALDALVKVLTRRHGAKHWRVRELAALRGEVTVLARLDEPGRRGWLEAWTCGRRATALIDQNDRSRAEPLLRRQVELLSAAPWSKTASRGQALARLGDLLRRRSRWADARASLQPGLGLLRQHCGDDHPLVGETWYSLAVALDGLGRLAEAERAMSQAVDVTARSHGPGNHWHLDAQYYLGGLRSRRGRRVEAAQILRSALAGIEEHHGKDNHRYRGVAGLLGEVVGYSGDQAEGVRLLEESIQARMGKPDEAYANFTGNLLSLIDLALARPDLDRAAKWLAFAGPRLRKSPGERSVQYGQYLFLQMRFERARGRRNQAEHALAAYLDNRRAALGADSRAYADVLHGAGRYFAGLRGSMTVYVTAEEAALAERLLQEALARYRTLEGEESLAVANAWHSLGVAARVAGDLGRAAERFEKALDLRNRLLDPGHGDRRDTINSLAVTFTSLGEYVRADALFREAVALARDTAGGDPVRLSTALGNLGTLKLRLNDSVGAEKTLREALALIKRHFGEQSDRFGNYAGRLAEVYLDRGEMKHAELFALASARAYRALGPSRGVDHALALGRLAEVYLRAGRAADALPVARDAVPRVAVAGPDNLLVAEAHLRLGRVQLAAGELGPAEQALRQARATLVRGYGPSHPTMLSVERTQALLADRRGRLADALTPARNAVRLAFAQMDLAAGVQSEREQLSQLAQLRGALDLYLALSARAAVPAEEVYAQVLGWKGSIFARQLQLRAGRDTADPAARRRYQRLQALAGALAQTAARPAAPGEQAGVMRRVAELTEEKERLEADLLRDSPAFRAFRTQSRLSPERLGKLLPTRTALVDFFEYTPPKSDGVGRGERQLAAFVVRPGRPVVRVELGSVVPLEEAVAGWRRQVRWTRTLSGERLRRLVWEPLERALRRAHTVLVSPDGPLARFPFAALPGPTGKGYLIEEMGVAVVPVPQLLPELLAHERCKPDAGSLLLAGNVDYQHAAGGAVASPAPPGSTWLRSGSQEGPWQALPGTRGEVDGLHRLFQRRFPGRPARLLEGEHATRAAVRDQAGAYRYLHLATHGYFDTGASGRPVLIEGESAGGYHPGLLSGLVLAGANAPPRPGGDDGLLTALEVATLDLRGVELAVLSACETGLGQQAGGEGVLGLQRAFQVAGARTVVASLWSVEDEATRRLMERFYTNLWHGRMSKLAALRQAQLWMIRQGGRAGTLRGAVREDEVSERSSGRAAPFVWAAFVLSGDWR